MYEVGQKLETKKEPFIAEVLSRNLGTKQYELMVNGSKVNLSETAIDLLMDKSIIEEKPVSEKLKDIVLGEVSKKN